MKSVYCCFAGCAKILLHEIMIPSAIRQMTIRDAGVLLRKRSISAVELTQAYLRRIEGVNDILRAYVAVRADEALQEAETADKEFARGIDRGPLHGIPLSIKDIFDIQGMPTRAGSRVTHGHLARKDAAVVERLRQAGAVLLGKVATQELALGSTVQGFMPARNPWNLEYSPGSSSSGSAAAVAAGLCMGSVGSCTAGSIREPASFCGIVGIKPTRGRISRYGMLSLSPTLDHVGIMTRRIEDASFILDAVGGYDPRDPVSLEMSSSQSELGDGKNTVIGIPRDFLSAHASMIDAEVLALFESSLSELERSGARLVDIHIPSLTLCGIAQTIILLREGFIEHRSVLQTNPDLVGDMARMRLCMGTLFTEEEYQMAKHVQHSLIEECGVIFETVDLVATPASSAPPPRLAEEGLMKRMKTLNFNNLFNMVGAPALSVPCGFTKAGLPVGLQLGGRWSEESMMLRAASALEKQLRLFDFFPPL